MDGPDLYHRLFVWSALSLSDRSSIMSRNVSGNAIRRWGFVSASSQQTRLSTPLFGFSVFIFSLSTPPHSWPLWHSASVFKNLQRSRFCTAEGVASQWDNIWRGLIVKINSFFFMNTNTSEREPVLQGSVSGDQLRCLSLCLCPVCWPNRQVDVC